MDEVQLRSARVRGRQLRWREAGQGAPLLLLHGWPTSSFLWRNIIPQLAPYRRVIAPDLPGMGESEKALDRPYDFSLFDDALDGLCEQLGLTAPIGLVIHDIGGPIGLHWASRSGRPLERLAILNTLVYPELHWMEWAAVLACRTPLLRRFFSSPRGIKFVLRLGLVRPSRLAPDCVEGLLRPFRDPGSREAMLRVLGGLKPSQMNEYLGWFRGLTIPIKMIYGAKDRVLHSVPKTARRLQRDFPKAEIVALPDCGHFLQEEQPEALGQALAAFVSGPTLPAPPA